MTPSALFNAALFNAAPFGGGTSPGRVIQVGPGILYPALRKAGVTLGPQRTPSPAQFQDAIDELQRLTASLNCDRLFIYSRATYLFPLTGAKTYTIGQDPQGMMVADFDVPRPEIIENANLVSNTWPPIRWRLALFDSLQWAKIQVQDIGNTITEALYYDRAYPIGTIYLWQQPVPSYLLELFVWTQVPLYTNLTDVVLLPPQYEDALVLNLAVRLVSHFPMNQNLPRQVDPNLYQQARESLMRLESINAPQPILDVDVLCGPRGRYMNPYSGQIR